MPPAARTTAPASLPPEGLPGLDPSWSRLLSVPRTPLAGSGADEPTVVTHQWHVLDNRHDLEALGVTPVGTVLCVHGNPTWSYLWRQVLGAATATAADGGPAWRVVAVDQLDMGYSERTGTPRDLARRVRDLADLTEALGVDGPVVTLGHDWGGVVSLGWAVDHPDQLRGVMLLNTAVHQPAGTPVPAPLRLALQVLGTGTVTTPAFLETTLALARPALPDAVKDAYRAPYQAPERRGGIGGFVADIPTDATHPSHPELERIATGVAGLTVPALLLWGAQDPVFGDRYLDDLLERLPHADVHRYEGAGHLVAEDAGVHTPVLAWLGDRHTDLTSPGTRTAPPTPGATQAWPRPPMWHQLDALADSTGTALVEMAPPSGPAPRVVSWQLLARRVRQIAAGLHQVGVRRGDRVSLLVPPGADLTAVLYACLRLGAVVVVADAGLGVRGL
ncbi:hydrolase, partial [Cellulomonas bogoriensis 69B4 = DSM 16987]